MNYSAVLKIFFKLKYDEIKEIISDNFITIVHILGFIGLSVLGVGLFATVAYAISVVLEYLTGIKFNDFHERINVVVGLIVFLAIVGGILYCLGKGIYTFILWIKENWKMAKRIASKQHLDIVD